MQTLAQIQETLRTLERIRINGIQSSDDFCELLAGTNPKNRIEIINHTNYVIRYLKEQK